MTGRHCGACSATDHDVRRCDAPVRRALYRVAQAYARLRARTFHPSGKPLVDDVHMAREALQFGNVVEAREALDRVDDDVARRLAVLAYVNEARGLLRDFAARGKVPT